MESSIVPIQSNTLNGIRVIGDTDNDGRMIKKAIHFSYKSISSNKIES